MARVEHARDGVFCVFAEGVCALSLCTIRKKKALTGAVFLLQRSVKQN